MLEEEASSHKDNSLHSLHMIEYHEDQWQSVHEPSNITLKRIVKLVSNLDAEYKTAGLTAIAEYFANALSLHFLDIMLTFQQKAEQEGIELDEREGIFHDILSESFPMMMELSRNILIQSLDALLTLSNITFGLYKLSHVDSAESARRWMYKLPKLYHSQLTQEHLLISAKSGSM
jgi:hypothetical protein